MKITEIKLYAIRAGNTGERGAQFGESQYWGGGWQTNSLIANPMSLYPQYAQVRTQWMGPGQDPYAIEIIDGRGRERGGHQLRRRPVCLWRDRKAFQPLPDWAGPFNIELIWDQMYRSVMPYGLGGVTSMAMSGVDLALWDLVGKALGQPVYRLAGGKTKESIPCYITTHPDYAKVWKDRGFLGVKIAAPWGAADGRDGLNKMQKCVEQTRADARQRHGDHD